MGEGFVFEEIKIITPEIYCDICDVLTSISNLGFNGRIILDNGFVMCYRCMRIAQGNPINEKFPLFENLPHREMIMDV